MSQVSSAVAYLHEKGLCLRGVNVENVVLMSEILADPIAKLSRLSTCCQGVSSQRATVEEVKLEFKDVNDLGHLLYSLITSGYRDLIGTNGQLPPLKDHEASCPAVAELIRLAWRNDSLSADTFAGRLARLDAEMNGDSAQPGALALGRSHFRSGGEYFAV